jgi:serine/threonine-protein kinase
MMRSVHYMAPEVAEGKPATPASDIYSLGIILFELLTGKLPFDGDTPIAIAMKHGRDPVPPLRGINPGIPKALEAVIMKALQKAPEDRFRSAKAMLNELNSVNDGLHFAKPIAWSQPSGKSAAPTEALESGKLAEAEPVILSVLRRTLLAVVGIFAALAAVMAWMVLVRPADVTLPNLVGKTIQQAEQMAAADGVQLTIRAEHYNEEYEAGAIYLMNPSAGRVIKKGKTVDVWVSKGSKFAKVPNVVKLPLEDAKQRIANVGLNIGEISQEYDGEIPAGDVIEQTPPAGTEQERDVPVNLVYSLGPEPSESSLSTENYNTSTETRSFDVKFTVPSGPEDQRAQIVVIDEYGETTAYSDTVHPGDRIEQTVAGVGDKITIRIYLDDKLVREERKWR